MKNNKPNWILLKECGEELTKRNVTPFSRSDLIDCVQKKDPTRKESSLHPMIQGITPNLKGGAPGGIGKKVFFSVRRGKFVLYDKKKDISNIEGSKEDTFLEHPTIILNNDIQEENEFSLNKKTTEDEIRDLVMSNLYPRIGNDSTWQGSGKKAQFDLKTDFSGFKCSAEKSLKYNLPSGKEISHKNDILIHNKEKGKYISIEIKHRSAVTDQFKCRSYDMLHLKKKYQNELLGIMIFVKSSSGISIEHAKELCYSFDLFYGIKEQEKHNPVVWDKITLGMTNFLKN